MDKVTRRRLFGLSAAAVAASSTSAAQVPVQVDRPGYYVPAQHVEFCCFVSEGKLHFFKRVPGGCEHSVYHAREGDTPISTEIIPG